MRRSNSELSQYKPNACISATTVNVTFSLAIDMMKAFPLLDWASPKISKCAHLMISWFTYQTL